MISIKRLCLAKRLLKSIISVFLQEIGQMYMIAHVSYSLLSELEIVFMLTYPMFYSFKNALLKN